MAVLVSAVVYFLFGWLWYSPVLFAKPWVALTKTDPEKMKPTPAPFIISFACEVLAAYGLGCIISVSHAVTFSDGATLGLFTGIALAATAGGMNYAFEGRPFKLFLINFSYPVVSYVIIGGILAIWK